MKKVMMLVLVSGILGSNAFALGPGDATCKDVMGRLDAALKNGQLSSLPVSTPLKQEDPKDGTQIGAPAL